MKKDSHQRQKGFAPILIVFVVVAIIGLAAGVVYFENKVSKSALIPLPKVAITAVNNTYQSKNGEVVFDYPTNFILKEESGNNQITADFSNGNEEFRFEILTPSTLMDGSASPSSVSMRREAKTVVFNGITWKIRPEFEYCDAGQCGTVPISIETERKNQYYTFYLFKTKEDSPVITQVLSTFKFLDTKPKITLAPASSSFTSVKGASLKEIKYNLPPDWEAKLDEDSLFISPKNEGGFLDLSVYDFPPGMGRKEFYCQKTKFCIDATYFTEMKIGNLSGYMANALDNSGGGAEYFAAKGDKFYIISSFNPPSPNEFEKHYKEVLSSLIF